MSAAHRPRAARILQPGVGAALAAALLFGAATPLAKLLLQSALSPWLLAGLLYLGSGLGMALLRLRARAPKVQLTRAEWGWLAAAIASGGVVAPVLLLWGLSAMPAAAASLLLNAEGVFTALLAWFVFKENFDRRIALGMAAILFGAVLLSWPRGAVPSLADAWPALAILAACAAWGLDNNLTRKVALADARWIASIKGLSAGAVNLSLALLIGTTLPPVTKIAAAMLLGWLAYGLSLSLFVLALRQLGTARTGAYFSVAPFFGALLAVVLGEPMTALLVLAGAFMAVGVGLHLSERHSHWHQHEPLEHSHAHVHDEHHQHLHEAGVLADADGKGAHTHYHRHEALGHEHAHFPDAHHPHRHD